MFMNLLSKYWLAKLLVCDEAAIYVDKKRRIFLADESSLVVHLTLTECQQNIGQCLLQKSYYLNRNCPQKLMH